MVDSLGVIPPVGVAARSRAPALLHRVEPLLPAKLTWRGTVIGEIQRGPTTARRYHQRASERASAIAGFLITPPPTALRAH
jgi:hypothetical protein